MSVNCMQNLLILNLNKYDNKNIGFYILILIYLSNSLMSLFVKNLI